MLNNYSQQIVTNISNIFKKRKLVVFFTIIGLLIPVLVYNHFAIPKYKATTRLILDGLNNPETSASNYDISGEIVVQNRLEEIKNLTFSADMVRMLPLDVYNNFKTPADEPPDFDRFAYIRDKVNRSISAVVIRDSAVLQISVEYDDPELCRDLANSAAQVFQQRLYKIRQAGVTGVRSFLAEQLSRIQTQLLDTEQQLRNYKESNRIISLDKGSQELLQKMTEVDALHNSVKVSRGFVEERLATIRKKLMAQKHDPVPSIKDIATPYIQKLKSKLFALLELYTDLKLQGNAANLSRMVQLQNEIGITKNNLKGEALKVVNSAKIVGPITQIGKYVNESYTFQIELETYRLQELALKKTMKNYEAQLTSLPEKEFVLARLVRQKEVLNKKYVMLKKRVEEVKVTGTEKLTNVRILDPARKPLKPISPRKKVNIVLGIILGLLLGFGIVFIQELQDTALDSTEELERVTNWHVLAAIPKNEKAASSRFALLKRHTNGNAWSPMIKQSMITGLEGKNGIAETYKTLCTNLQFLGLGDKCKTILATSISQDEGNSTTLTNLGIALANMDQKVLLVDSDLRWPQMHTVFEVDKEPGLSDLLVYHNSIKADYSVIENGHSLGNGNFAQQEMNELVDNFSDFVMDGHFISKINNLAAMSTMNILNSSLVEAIQSTKIENLKILSSGRQLKNPSKTIASISMKSLLEELKNRFDVVLIDSAPLLLVPETMVVSSLVDGVLFVVDSQKYNKEMLLRAKDLLNKANATVIGCVLNNAKIEVIGKSVYYSDT